MVNADKAFLMRIIRIRNALSALTMAGSVSRTGLPVTKAYLCVRGNGDESIFMRPGDGSSAWIKAMTLGHGQMATTIGNGDESINILVRVVFLNALDTAIAAAARQGHLQQIQALEARIRGGIDTFRSVDSLSEVRSQGGRL